MAEVVDLAAMEDIQLVTESVQRRLREYSQSGRFHAAHLLVAIANSYPTIVDPWLADLDNCTLLLKPEHRPDLRNILKFFYETPTATPDISGLLKLPELQPNSSILAHYKDLAPLVAPCDPANEVQFNKAASDRFALYSDGEDHPDMEKLSLHVLVAIVKTDPALDQSLVNLDNAKELLKDKGWLRCHALPRVPAENKWHYIAQWKECLPLRKAEVAIKPLEELEAKPPIPDPATPPAANDEREYPQMPTPISEFPSSPQASLHEDWQREGSSPLRSLTPSDNEDMDADLDGDEPGGSQKKPKPYNLRTPSERRVTQKHFRSRISRVTRRA
ncbi:hypothetical protein CALVIDRAFT_540081 [Calocera viscosa TUFC12733]|uniref:Uncharacterized protein n=1 Tax=Calocera viscosa (strain TUFC12733) TaxID=1330018 RepID=A0A167J8U4_CALVF|nr:hypothetical protein CALVIDRAFT_540081 [Calocera viscosa TUFC12733]